MKPVGAPPHMLKFKIQELSWASLLGQTALHNFTPTVAIEETMLKHSWWHIHCSMEIALWIVFQQDFSPFRKVKDEGLKRENYSELLKHSSFWPCTHRQHSHLQLVWGYLHNTSGGLWQGWQVQVKIPEPVLQNSELASKSVCKDLSARDLLIDSFSFNPRAVMRTSTWTCSTKKHQSK